jgi:hypothetical protein
MDPARQLPATTLRVFDRSSSHLVGHQRLHDGEDIHESGLDQIVDHDGDVFVSVRSLFVEQFPVFANHVAAEFGAGEVLGGEPVLDPRAAIGARPFSPRTVGKGKPALLARILRRDEVGEGSARSGNNDRSYGGRRRTFPMKPAGAVGKVDLLHPVVANVDEASALRSQALKDPDSDQFAIRRRPIPGVIVARQIVSGVAAARPPPPNCATCSRKIASPNPRDPLCTHR